MIVYVDIFLLENTILNLIILVSVSIFTKSRIKFLKFLISAFIGSIYTFVEYYYLNNFLLNLLGKLLFSICIVCITFDGKLDKKIKYYLSFILISFLYGGITYFIQIFFKLNNLEIRRENLENDVIGIFPVNTLILGFLIGFMIIFFISKYFNKINDYKKMICDIEICILNKCIKTKGLIDSGNLLKDPITKQNVIVVESNILKTIIEKEELDFLENISLGNILKEEKNSRYSKYKIKIIPFNSLGNSNGILCGIKPDFVKINFEEEFLLKNIIIGIYFDKLSSDNEYFTLIGGGCLKEDFI